MVKDAPPTIDTTLRNLDTVNQSKEKIAEDAKAGDTFQPLPQIEPLEVSCV